MTTRILSSILVLSAVIGLASCAQTERAEGVTAEIEAAQMEGRRAARRFLAASPADTAATGAALRDVRARSDSYRKIEKAECAAAFDSAFVGTIRAVSPDRRPAY